MRSTAPERHLPSIALVLTQAAASGRSNRLRYHPYSQNPSSSVDQEGHMVDPPLALRLCGVLSFFDVDCGSESGRLPRRCPLRSFDVFGMSLMAWIFILRLNPRKHCAEEEGPESDEVLVSEYREKGKARRTLLVMVRVCLTVMCFTLMLSFAGIYPCYMAQIPRIGRRRQTSKESITRLRVYIFEPTSILWKVSGVHIFASLSCILWSGATGMHICISGSRSDFLTTESDGCLLTVLGGQPSVASEHRPIHPLLWFRFITYSF